MKKRIIALVSCVFVLVAALSVGVSANLADTSSTYWKWLFDRRNQIDISNVLDPAYDIDKTPDVYFALGGSGVLAKPDQANLLMQNASGYVRLNYYNYATQKEGVYDVPVADVIGLATYNYIDGETIDNLEWFVRYRMAESGANLRFNYDRDNGYFVSSYYPHLHVWKMEFFIYLNTDVAQAAGSSTFGMNQQRMNYYGVYPDFPYVARNYFDQGGYDAGYAQGEADGFISGYEEGRAQSYNEGYEDGKTAGILEGERNSTAWMNFKNLIFMIFDAPFYVLSTALDFEVFGINIAGTLIGLISLTLIVWILKIIIVRLF